MTTFVSLVVFVSPKLTATNPNKLSPRSTHCVFLGYPRNHRGYRCLDLATNKMIISRHVIFNEQQFPLAQTQNVSPTSYEPSPLFNSFFYRTSPAPLINVESTASAPSSLLLLGRILPHTHPSDSFWCSKVSRHISAHSSPLGLQPVYYYTLHASS